MTFYESMRISVLYEAKYSLELSKTLLAGKGSIISAMINLSMFLKYNNKYQTFCTIEHVKHISTMQSFTGISRNTQSKSHYAIID